MNRNKLLIRFLIFSILCTAMSIGTFAENEPLAPKQGDQVNVNVTWTRTSEPIGAKNLPVASWNWSDIKDINCDQTNEVWDGGSIGQFYLQGATREWDIATWHTKRFYWNGTSDLRRFRGEFTIPDGYSVFDDITISSVGNYTELGLENIIPINDNIYVFVHPKDQEINDTNFLQFFAFWTGTACQEAAKQVNNGEFITFHGIPGTTPHDYKEVVGSPIPKENILSHTDGWYCDATQDNIGYIIKNSPDSAEFVIDLIVEDYAEDGGMDRLELIFTKVSDGAEIIEEKTADIVIVFEGETMITEGEIPKVHPSILVDEFNELPEYEIPKAPPYILGDEAEISEETAKKSEIRDNPKGGDIGMMPYLYLIGASVLGMCYFLRKRKQY